MTIFLWLINLVFGILTVAPLIQGDLFRVDHKYTSFRFVSIILVLWWLIDFLRLLTTDGVMLYYLTALVYPTVFLFVLSFYIAIKRYFESKVNPIFQAFLIIIFIVIFSLSMTNNLHQLMFKSLPENSLVYEDTLAFEMGILFYVHTVISYALLVFITVTIFNHITKRLRKNKDIYPFLFILVSIAIGVSLNIYQIFINTLHLDPTLLSSIVFITVLYYVFYIRDLKLLLGFNRNRFILNQLREKYVVVDEMGTVVDASKEFVNQFGISIKESLLYTDLVQKMQESAVLFKESHDVLKDYDHDKIYLNTLEKSINLPFYKHSGMFYLFFDQTANLKNIYDMNYIKTHDLMTEIYNRNFLEDIRNDLDDSNSFYQIAMFDVDGLKLFNDYLGHNQGDDLLIRFASQLKDVSKKQDVYPIRLGGDEFIILAVNQSKDYIGNLVNTLVKFNETLPFIERIQFSYAISERTEEHNSMKMILANADKMMYEMKKNKDNYKDILKAELLKITNSK